MVTINQFLEVVAKLRDPQTGCPWDIKQDFDSMPPIVTGKQIGRAHV